MKLEKLICSYLSNELGFHDKQKLDKWVNDRKYNQSILNDYKKIWHVSAMTEEKLDIPFNADEGWDRFQRKISRGQPKNMEEDDTQIDIKDFPRGIRNFINDQR